MSVSDERDLLLSQLVDGELPADQTAEVLLEALDDAEAQARLKAMLRLRQSLEPWRRQEPRGAIVAAPPARHAESASRFRRLAALAAAAVLGGVLVAGGFYLGNRLVGQAPNGLASDPRLRQRNPVMIVTPEQRRDIDRAFALHESVAGPLSWYAADDSTIQVAPAEKGETMRQPIAIVLRFERDGSCPTSEVIPPKTYVVVCHSNDSATIELPSWAMAKTVHLRLLPTATDGEVNLRYAIAADGSATRPDGAALAGNRQIGIGQTSLGQLALNDCLVNVDATAWVIRDRTP